MVGIRPDLEWSTRLGLSPMRRSGGLSNFDRNLTTRIESWLLASSVYKIRKNDLPFHNIVRELCDRVNRNRMPT
jgi:hypothetical protein